MDNSLVMEWTSVGRKNSKSKPCCKAILFLHMHPATKTYKNTDYSLTITVIVMFQSQRQSEAILSALPKLTSLKVILHFGHHLCIHKSWAPLPHLASDTFWVCVYTCFYVKYKNIFNLEHCSRSVF